MEQEEISQYMNSIGFDADIDTRYNTVRYLSQEFIVEDLHPGNIWKTPNGHIVIIDGHFKTNLPEYNLGGTFLY